VKQESHEEGTVAYPNEDVDAGKVSDLHPTTPTNEDVYVEAADAITEWTSVVEPEKPVDHIPYKEVPTEKPVEQGTDGFPSQRDSYTVASGNVAAWPEVDLEATNALEEKKVADEMADAKPQVFADPETVPTEKDIYDDAAESITDWTSVVEPENAVDHIPYKEVPTEKPVEQGTDGFPTQRDSYTVAAGNVAAWPEVDLEATNALEEKKVADEMAGAKPQVFDDPETVPTEKDIYHDAADAITDWTSVVEPENATDHIPYKEVATEKPVEQGTDGFPTQEDIYGEASRNVAAWPENSLDDSKVVAEEQLVEDDVKLDKPDDAKSE
jgi:hypothetical protein